MGLSTIKKPRKGQTSLPKLRSILASPYKTTYDVLEAAEIENFKELLFQIINKSGLDPRAFATSHRISIGLGAVLRSIKNLGISCVFISLKIKPRFISDLIAKYAQLRNPAAYVCTLSNLEEFTEQIFGMRALAFTLPLETSLDPDLREWIKKKTLKSTEVSESVPHNKLVATKCNLGKAILGVEEITLSSNLGKVVPVEGCSKLSVMNSNRKNAHVENVELNINKFKETVIQSGKSMPIKYHRLEINKMRPNPNRILKRQKRKSDKK